ncbi:MAG: YgjP-like metallopeptidase domain-containing protein [Acidimicrobiales bacterium]
MLSPPLPWYQLRRGKGRLPIRIKISSIGGLEVTASPSTHVEEVTEFLNSRSPWIARYVMRYGLALSPRWEPTSLWTPSVGRSKEVEDRATAHAWPSWATSPATEQLGGPMDFPILAGQLRRFARRDLDLALRQEFERLTSADIWIRVPLNLRTAWMSGRWGSCHQAGRITINLAAAFLASPLRRHIIAHEISHLFVGDHSAAFWSTLERYDPEWGHHRAMLTSSASALPWWTRVRPTHELVLWRA